MFLTFRKFAVPALLCLITITNLYSQTPPIPANDYTPILGKYEFYYHHKYIPIDICLEDGLLKAVEPNDDPLTLEPAGGKKYEFTARNNDDTYHISFILNDAGSADTLIWKDGEETIPAPRFSWVPRYRFSKQEMREDLLEVRERLESLHPIMYEFTPKEEFDRRFDQALASIDDSMGVEDFYNLAKPLVAAVGCGHTNLRTPPGYWDQAPQRILPLRLHFSNGHAFVLRDLADKRTIEPGAEVLTINGVRMKEIIEKSLEYLPADGMNISARYCSMNRLFNYLYALVYGFPEEFIIEYLPKDADGKFVKKLKPVDVAAVSSYWKLFIPSSSAGGFIKDLDIKVYAQKNTALMTIRTFGYYNEKVPQFHSFIDSSFQVMQNNAVENLVLDLRGNAGGDPFCSAHLFSYLAKESVPYFAEEYGKYAEFAQPVPLAENRFNRDLYTLIDGDCFSSTGHFTALLKYHGIGKFIGQETGATYTCNDNKTRMQLKNSRFRFQVARGSFAAAVEGMPGNRGIIPDYPVEPSVDDILGGSDPVMNYVLSLIN